MIKKGIMYIFLFVCVVGLLQQLHQTQTLIVPISLVQRANTEIDSINTVLVSLGEKPNTDTAEAIVHASKVTDINKYLITALMYTESKFKSFDNKGKILTSPKGYKGVMQTRFASGEKVVDTLFGAVELKKKLKSNNDDIFEALADYKGGRAKPEARKQAKEVLVVYKRIINTK